MVILCESGIRTLIPTFAHAGYRRHHRHPETSHLQFSADPCTVPDARQSGAMAAAAVAAGADGLLIEVHNDPDQALLTARNAGAHAVRAAYERNSTS